jgi:hypothetical protein
MRDCLLIGQDTFNTPFMPATVGSFALRDTKITNNAALVDAVQQDISQDGSGLTTCS